ncbi:hypothetical protein PTKIN_Ptkin14bG0080200 [Pterospermum kingtungense]
MVFTLVIFLFTLLKLGNRFMTNNLIPNLPPGPLKLPVIGNLHLLAGSLPHQSLRDLANKFGPLMHLQLGEMSNIVVFLSSNCSRNIAFSPYGDYWRQLRKICVLEMLSSKRVQSFSLIREEEVSKLDCLWWEMQRERGIHITFQGNYKGGFRFTVADLFPSVKLLQFLSGLKPELERLHQKVDMILENVINEHKASKEMTKTSEEESDDILDVLLTLQENGDLEFPLTTDNIKAVILDLFLAGTEPSSIVVQWAMSELIRNPEVLKKAKSEVRHVFASTRHVTESGIQDLKYLNLVINETLRLHAPAPLLIPRECQESCEVNGYLIPAKYRNIVNAWAIGRNGNYWPEADKFYPERFLDNSISYKGTDFELIPFGSGRRICPGMSFGSAIVELILANLLYHFDWKLPDGKKHEDLDMTEFFSASLRRKHDLYLIPIPYHFVTLE